MGDADVETTSCDLRLIEIGYMEINIVKSTVGKFCRVLHTNYTGCTGNLRKYNTLLVAISRWRNLANQVTTRQVFAANVMPDCSPRRTIDVTTLLYICNSASHCRSS